ncbi:DUF2807 domain-containing protein [Panacibacter sp. DH6]|uniref:DUF2807 domain-containing protein n=1 Tax=Panacibacter microcysteis TaxID=2793269 RepID=A0A931GYB5_9BACT|nr:head GIN domain-containing protein [Panacibacter microcysteis]MBG9375132.1 DUF2807 domain-containing protein [Panacibacter microcysteis]
MKRLIVFALLAISLNSFAIGKTIKGNGIHNTETRPAGNFTRLSVGGPMNVTIRYGNSTNLTIDGDENLLPYIETTVKDGTLKIKVKDLNNINPTLKLTIQVSMTTIDGIAQAGSGTVSGSGNFESNGNTSFNMSGSGKLSLSFASFKASDISMSGSGSMQLKGNIEGQLEIHQSGSGSIDCLNAPCQSATARISGSGNMKLNAAKNLEAHISGSGAIYYSGSPSLNSHISGSGRIKKI